MTNYLHVVPAYGRDYPSEAAVRADWDAGKDFRIQDISAGWDDGRYINKEDLERHRPGNGVNIRYNRLRNVCVIDP